jgi:hypothetical protein
MDSQPNPMPWFGRVMTLVDGQATMALDGSTNSITFDAFDALCNAFITDEYSLAAHQVCIHATSLSS